MRSDNRMLRERGRGNSSYMFRGHNSFSCSYNGRRLRVIYGRDFTFDHVTFLSVSDSLLTNN